MDADGNATVAPVVNRLKSFDDSGTPAVVAGVIMIAIAVIMLIISPTIMFMKMIEKRKNRIFNAVSTRVEKTPILILFRAPNVIFYCH